MELKQLPPVTVISGIDSGVGKTVATGLLARWFRDNSMSVITMKMVQTGCTGISKDIIKHRNLSGMEMVEEDAMGMTCPYVFEMPFPPHLAARLAGMVINPERITTSVTELLAKYDHVLLEATGGIMVPLGEEVYIIDMLQKQNWPVVLVTSPRSQSVNHTLSCLEILENRQVQIQGIVYNLKGSENIDARIIEDSRMIFTKHLDRLKCSARICDIPNVSCTASYCVDFSPLFTQIKGVVNEF